MASAARWAPAGNTSSSASLSSLGRAGGGDLAAVLGSVSAPALEDGLQGTPLPGAEPSLLA